jgi:hypothetical protein
MNPTYSGAPEEGLSNCTSPNRASTFPGFLKRTSATAKGSFLHARPLPSNAHLGPSSFLSSCSLKNNYQAPFPQGPFGFTETFTLVNTRTVFQIPGLNLDHHHVNEARTALLRAQLLDLT